jgi:hypothetical protein
MSEEFPPECVYGLRSFAKAHREDVGPILDRAFESIS